MNECEHYQCQISVIVTSLIATWFNVYNIIYHCTCISQTVAKTHLADFFPTFLCSEWQKVELDQLRHMDWHWNEIPFENFNKTALTRQHKASVIMLRFPQLPNCNELPLNPPQLAIFFCCICLYPVYSLYSKLASLSHLQNRELTLSTQEIRITCHTVCFNM